MCNSYSFDSDPKEKCGVIGVWSSSSHAPSYARRGLAALQHRGQESAGLSVLTASGNIKTYKSMGLIPLVLTENAMKNLGDSIFAVGHNRYGTSGDSSESHAQPIELNKGEFQISIGHNGNIPDIGPLCQSMGVKEDEATDTSLMAALLINERPNFLNWEQTMMHVLPRFKGAYSLIILTNDGSLYGVRDPYGIRPLSLGSISNGLMISSESVSFDVVGGNFIRDILPGEIIRIDKDGNISSTFFGEVKYPQFDIFEFIYFSRPDSFLNGRRVRAGRERSGILLGERLKKKHIHPEVVVPTFESGYPAAKGVAQALDLPIVDAITTSNYIGRTFIQPGQANRVAAVNGKHNIIADEVVGKKVVVVDDSAVRLTTSRMITFALRNAGVDKIYLAFASPPVVNQCDMGIDMRSRKYLPAAAFDKESIETIEKEMAKHAGADDVIYLPIEQTAEAMGGKPHDFYYFPFGGPHPVRGKQIALPKRKHKMQVKAKLCVFISGRGTNLQHIIDQIKSKDLDAEITGVLSNNPDAPGVTRAKTNHIPTTILPFEGNSQNQKERKTYEDKLIAYVKDQQPDIIVLAGWMWILGDNFIKTMQEMEIPVINLHPALLTKNAEEFVTTSRGRIPVLRGIHAIREAFDKNLQVSGVTVYQILPKAPYDVGPVIIKAEVRRKEDDSPELWEKKIHEMEYQLLPAALKRIIHVMKEGVDVSNGEYPW